MKKIIIALAVLAFCSLAASAQDFVTKKNGEDIAAIVEEVGPDYVRFRLWEEPEGVVYLMEKSEILMIRYATGRNEVFGNTPYIAVAPAMKYRQLSEIYDYRNYVPSLYDRYSPAWSGVASLFIPGLGQMICGEVGRGFAWLGGSVGCSILAGIAGVSEAPALYVMAMAGLLAVDIGAIVDGVRVAKVKNMYEDDLRTSRYSFDLDLYPSVDYIKTAAGVQPTAGMTLAFRF